MGRLKRVAGNRALLIILATISAGVLPSSAPVSAKAAEVRTTTLKSALDSLANLHKVRVNLKGLTALYAPSVMVSYDLRNASLETALGGLLGPVEPSSWQWKRTSAGIDIYLDTVSFDETPSDRRAITSRLHDAGFDIIHVFDPSSRFSDSPLPTTMTPDQAIARLSPPRSGTNRRVVQVVGGILVCRDAGMGKAVSADYKCINMALSGKTVPQAVCALMIAADRRFVLSGRMEDDVKCSVDAASLWFALRAILKSGNNTYRVQDGIFIVRPAPKWWPGE